MSLLLNQFVFSRLFSSAVHVKWGKEKYKDIECDTDEPPMVFKAQLFSLTGVQQERQKVMVKGAVVKVTSPL